MQEILTQLLDYIRGIWRNRWYIIVLGWFVCLSGWYYVQQMPDEYEASARVYIDTQSVLKPLLRGLTIDSNLSHRVALMTRTLLSRPNMEKVARMSDLDLKAKSPLEMERLIDNLQDRIALKGTNKVNLYTISYTQKNPEQAKKVVQSLLNILVEKTLGDTRRDADTAQEFLDRQIAEYEARLEAAEERLAEFKRKHVGMMPGEGGTYYTKLQAAQSELAQAELALEEAERRRDALESQLVGEEPSFGAMSVRSTPETTMYDQRIQSLQQRLDELLLKYTEQHPDVMAIKRTIEDLQQQKQEELESRVGASPDAQGLEANPVYQQLKVSLSEAEAQVAAAQVRVNTYRQRVQRLRENVDRIPKVEAELTRLNRDYEVNKKNYEALLARREAAQMSEDAEQSADNIKFKIIDPPRVPSVPSGPDRPLLSTLVLLLGVGGGIGLALLLSQVRPTFGNPGALKEVTGIPVLGAVSMVWNPRQTRRKHMESVAFVGAGIALVLVYLGVLMLHLSSSPGQGSGLGVFGGFI